MKRIFFIFLLLLVIFSFSSKSVAEEEEEEGEEREFDYRGKKGPANWGDLKEEWYHCKNGTMQSPINIDMFNVTVRIIPGSMSMKKRYKPFYGIVKNRGHDISIRWKDNKAGYIEINGSRYFLHQAHWHSPSEHTINGKRFDLELHMVHETLNPNATSKLAVVAVLYKIGRSNAFLSQLTKHLKDELGEKKVGVIDPMDVQMGGRMYYRYMGSLTVPPCTQGVIWTINKKIRTVSKGQVRALRMAVHDYAQRNARPLQDMNGRGVELYWPILHGSD